MLAPDDGLGNVVDRDLAWLAVTCAEHATGFAATTAGNG
jgi:hypothetical protein